MKKLLIINTKYRKFGGEDSNIQDEINLLSKKFKIDFLEYDNNERISIFDILSLFTNGNYKSNKKLKEHIKAFSPDYAYVHNLWFKGNTGIFKILNENNIKTFHKIHNYRLSCSTTFSLKKHLNDKSKCYGCNMQIKNLQFFNKYFTNSYIKSLFLIFFSKKSINMIKKYKINLLVLNTFHKNYLIDFGLDPHQVKVFYNPINFKSIKYSNYNPKSNYVLYGGVVSKEKGVLELIKAWDEAKVKNLVLKIAGDSNDLILEEIGIENKTIEVLGHIPHNELLDLIQNARAVVTATKLLEGQPRLLCEASSFGIPSIYPSFGGMDEYFPENYPLSFEQYNYKNLAEKIKKLEDSELLAKKSIEVQSFIEKALNVEKLLDEFENITDSSLS